jgi:hypothetical protein
VYVRTYFGVRDCFSVYVPYGNGPRSSRHYSKLAVYVAEILVYREGQVAPLFEKKVHGIVGVQHHAIPYKKLRT